MKLFVEVSGTPKQVNVTQLPDDFTLPAGTAQQFITVGANAATALDAITNKIAG